MMRARRPLKKWWRRAVLAIALAAIGLGMYSFLSRKGSLWDPVHWFDAALSTLQLFVIQIAPKDLEDLQGRLAAVLAPLATAGATVAAFGARANRWRELVLLWWRPATDVFLGGGATAAGIAMRRHRPTAGNTGRHARPKGKVVGLDLRSETPLARQMENFDTPCFQHVGDALAADQVTPLRLHKARTVWVTSGDDCRNIEIARRARACIAALSRDPSRPFIRRLLGKPNREKPVRLLVNVFDHHLIRAEKELFPPLNGNRTALEFFSMPRLAARTLLLEHPPRVVPGHHAPHLLIIGSGDLAAALTVHAAQHCVYSELPADSVRITLAGVGSRALHKRLQQRHPALAAHSDDYALKPLLPLARITTVECDECELTLADWQRLQRSEPFSAVYVACDHDVRTVTAAKHVVALREITPISIENEENEKNELPVIACLQQADGSVCAMAGSEGRGLTQNIEGLQWFDIYERCIRNSEDYPGQQQDDRAKLIELLYRLDGDEKLEDKKSEDADVVWDTVHEPFRWSDRLTADHIDVKLKILQRFGLQLGRDGEQSVGLVAQQVGELLKDPKVLDLLCRLEHRRYLAERLLEGWLPIPDDLVGKGPSGLSERLQKTELRLNQTLVPFNILLENETTKDQKIVRATPIILKLSDDWRLRRHGASHGRDS